jgi:hypothetical protein
LAGASVFVSVLAGLLAGASVFAANAGTIVEAIVAIASINDVDLVSMVVLLAYLVLTTIA